MIKNEDEHRKDIVEICRRIYQKGWIAASDGNVSVRLPRGRILATPTKLHKGFITERDLVVIDMEGRQISGKYAPSSEIRMHLYTYEKRPEIMSVVHAHPTYCVAFTLAKVSLAKCMLPEVVFTLGSIPTAAYSTPTTEEVPQSIQKYIKDFDAIILERHGSLTAGKTVFDAYNLLERIEHVAQITHAARQLGDLHPLTDNQIEKLKQVGSDLGLPQKKILKECETCNACPSGKLAPFQQAQFSQTCSSSAEQKTLASPPLRSGILPSASKELMEIIVQEVKRELDGSS